MTIILGIDPGSRITGYGLIRASGTKYSFIDCGMIAPTQDSLPERLHIIYQQIAEVIKTFQPTEMSIESVFMSRNADSALKLGHARGAAIVCALNHNLSVAEYTARQAKLSVVGSGGADKEQVQFMVTRLLGLPEPPQEDAADALGLALCHGFARQTNQQLRLSAKESLPLQRRTHQKRRGRLRFT